MEAKHLFRLITLLLYSVCCTAASTKNLNSILSDVTLTIPEEVIQVDSHNFSSLVIGVVRCNSISVDNVEIKAVTPLKVETKVQGLSIVCRTDRVGLKLAVSTSKTLDLGGVVVSCDDSSVTTKLEFKVRNHGNFSSIELASTDWELDPNFEISYDSDDSMFEGMVNTALDVLTTHFTDRISAFLRDKLGSFASPVLVDGVHKMSALILDIETKQQAKTATLDIEAMEAEFGFSHSTKDLKPLFLNEDIEKLVQDARSALFTASIAEDVVSPVQSVVQGFLTPGRDETTHSLQYQAADDIILYHGGDHVTDVVIKLQNVKVEGLDSLHSIDLFKPVGDFTFFHSVQLKSLKLIANLQTQVSLRTGEDRLATVDDFEVSLTLDELLVEMATAGGLSKSALQNVSLGSLLKSPLQCVVKSLYGLEVPYMKVDFSTKNPLPEIISTDSSQGIGGIFVELFDTTKAILGPSLVSGLPDIMSSLVESSLNTALRLLLESADECQPLTSGQDGKPEYVDFETNPYFLSFSQWFQENVVKNLNMILPDIFIIVGDTPLTVLTPTKTPFGTISMAVHHAEVTNLDTIHDTVWMKLVKGAHYPYEIRNQLSLGTSREPVTLKLQFLFDIHVDDQPGSSEFNEFTVTFQLENFRILLDFLAMVDVNQLFQVSISSLPNLHCWLSFISGGITDFELMFENLKFDLTCDQCASESIQEIDYRTKVSRANEDLTENVNEWLKTVFDRVFSDHRWGNFDNFVAANCRAGIPMLGQEQSSHWILSNPAKEEEKNYLERIKFSMLQPMSTVTIGLVLVSCLFLSAIVSCCLHPPARLETTMDEQQDSLLTKVPLYSDEQVPSRLSKRFERLGSDLLDESESQSDVSGRIASFESSDSADSGHSPSADQALAMGSLSDEEEAERKFSSCALYRHPYVPLWVRVLVPISLMLNVGLFIVGHTMVGATVNVRVVLAGNDLEIPQVATFSLGESIQGMWKAKAYPLALLIASLSGVWPYTKILCMGYCWFVPPRWKSSSARTRLLLFLDFLGKWSLIDVYVLVFCVVAYDLDIVSPKLDVLPDQFYYVSVRVVPALGLIAFTTAAMLSLLTNNLCIVYNRHAIALDRKEADVEVLWAPSTLDVKAEEETKTAPMHNARQKPLQAFKRNLATIHSRKRGSKEELESLTVGCPQEWEREDRPPKTLLSIGAHDQEKVAVADLPYNLKTPSSGKAALRTSIKWLVSFSLVAGITLIVQGGVSTVFTFETSGIVGVAVDFQSDTPVEHGSQVGYSLITFFQDILDSSIEDFVKTNDSSSIPAGAILTPTYTYRGVYYFLALSYILTGFVIPVFHSLLLLVLWNFPLTLSSQQWLVHLSEGVGAWASLEVLLISLIVAALELSQVSTFLIGSFCDDVQPFLEAYLVPFGLIWAKDATCLKVQAILNIGCAKLVGGGLLINFLGQVVQVLSEESVRQRESDLMGNKDFMRSERRKGCRNWVQAWAFVLLFGTTKNNDLEENFELVPSMGEEKQGV